MKLKKQGAFFTAVFLLLNIWLASAPAAATSAAENAGAEGAADDMWAQQSYQEYLNGLSEQNYTGESIVISGIDYTAGTGAEVSAAGQDNTPVLQTEEDSFVEWSFSVGKPGMYAFRIGYYPTQGNGSEIQRTILIDGEVTVSELESVRFKRIFRDAQPIERVDGGNDIRYEQEEIFRKIEANVTDADGFYGDALYFYLSEGTHTIALRGIQEPMAVETITVFSERSQLPGYEEYLAANPAEDAAGVLENGISIYEAEEMLEKSDSVIYGTSDITSPKNSPYDYAYQKLNVIDGSRWKEAGQWITYQVTVAESGYYHIGFRFRQKDARQSVRRLYIDSSVPFEEADQLVFDQDDGWQVSLAGGETPYRFYLEQGTHDITLEITASTIKDSLISAEQYLDALNEINWSLMTVLGTEPDTNRDYQLETYMPQLKGQLADCADGLSRIAEEWNTVAGQNDSGVAEIRQLSELIRGMSEKPSTIPLRYSFFRDSVSSFATLIENEKLQPLTLDYLFLAEPGAALPAADSGLLEKIKYGFLRFLSSFVHDYDSLNNGASGQAIKIWIGNGLSGGRDQALVLNRLISQEFVPVTGINADLQLVPAGTILTATLAGRGPDVALQLTGSDPVNYAMRNAVLPLSDFEDYPEVAARFVPSSLVGFTYLDRVYALPETMDFPVLFYRKDILNSLGIDINSLKTWDDVINVLPDIQAGNMNFAIPAAYTSYYLFLFQNGGSLYDSDGTRSMLGEKQALDAFDTYMKFYQSYSLPYSYSLETRIRSGEIPLAVANYSTYNVVKLAAPEIDGLWGIAPVPGTRQEDGSILSVAPNTCAGCVIMSSADRPDDCWEFIKWWTSADIQYKFGRELESSMGMGARYNTANIEAVSKLPWTAQERTVILDQAEQSVGIPEVPGGYMTQRNVEFAIKAVYTDNKDARNTLLSYISAIDDEIELKRKEFHLDQ